MAKTDFKTIDEYHKAFPAEIQERMQLIHKVVKEISPDSAYAKHISLSSPWSKALLQEFEADLKGLKVTKSAIQLPSSHPLPVGLIKRIVAFRKAEIKAEV